VRIEGAGATGNRVEGNFIGTNAAGSDILANGADGVALVDVASNTIGGTAGEATRNVISGNRANGVEVTGPGGTGNLISGNSIGTDAVGIDAVGNGGRGVALRVVAGLTVGGINEFNSNGTFRIRRGNVISGNRRDGVEVARDGATRILIAGNFIGTDAA